MTYMIKRGALYYLNLKLPRHLFLGVTLYA